MKTRRPSVCRFLSKVILTLILIVFGIILFFRRRKENQWLTRKQTIVAIILLDLIFYLAYQWSYWNPALYFQVSYFQYIFFCYLLFYFGRKSILLSTLSVNSQLDISPAIQLKLSKLIFIGLVILFTTIFAFSYIEYILDPGDYSLCKAKFFNIVTMVGFLIEGLFLLQMRQLSRKIVMNVEVEQIMELKQLESRIRKRLKYLWILVILCFIGSSIEFVQNIYFVIMNTKFGSSYNCTYVINGKNQKLTDILNSSIDLIEKLVTYFVPYIITYMIFWDTKLKVPMQDQLPTYSYDTYVIQMASQDQNSKTPTFADELSDQN